jgi:hypothetical protein
MSIVSAMKAASARRTSPVFDTVSKRDESCSIFPRIMGSIPWMDRLAKKGLRADLRTRCRSWDTVENAERGAPPEIVHQPYLSSRLLLAYRVS